MTIFNFTLRARIFVSMLVLLFLSFFLTGAISIYHFWEENEEYHEERLKRKENTINASIDYFLGSYPEVNDDSLTVVLDNKICEWADVNNMDINIYSLRGNLLITSNAQLVLDSIVQPNIPDEFIKQLLRNESIVVKHQTDSVVILSSYKVIYDNIFNPLAIVNLPYFEEDKIPQNDIAFLETLISLYILLFMVAVIVAYFLSNYITGSLKTIGDKLKRTRFSNENEPLVWKSKDEIGRLVQEYNRMLKLLEENAVALARKERESAWKEMAKQVAHEIKNPLTPMRLMVQHLEITLKTEDKEQLKEFIDAMIDQIDTMANIADAFSQFANMPVQKKQTVTLNELVEKAARFYSHLDVSTSLTPVLLFALADRDQLLRVLNNLIKNAWQSVPEDRKPKIEMSLTEKDKEAIIAIKDNGSGIEPNKYEKIFEPSFTTKTQGMGLGLAMSKNIIEGVGGKIWFHTILSKGTTFYISIPLVQSQK